MLFFLQIAMIFAFSIQDISIELLLIHGSIMEHVETSKILMVFDFGGERMHNGGGEGVGGVIGLRGGF